MQGGRKLSAWNIFVQKIYREGKAKDAKYEFKQALSDASERKSEMGTKGKMTKKGGKKRKGRKGTRRHRN